MKKAKIIMIFKRFFRYVIKIKDFSLEKGIYYAIVVNLYYINALFCKFFKLLKQNKFHDNFSNDNIVKQRFLDFILHNISNVEVILEIGSRDAIQSIEFSRIFPDAKIYAFECHPSAIRKCIENIKNIKNIEIIPYAISNKNEKKLFFPVITNAGASSLYKIDDVYSFFRKQPQYEIEVNSIRIDTWAKRRKINRIDLCWLDLQGAEYEAFQGMGNLIYDIQAIYTEVIFKRIYKKQKRFKDIYKFLKRKGFSLIRTNREGGFWWGNAIFISNLYKNRLNIH